MDDAEKMSGEELVVSFENLTFECGEWDKEITP